MNIMQYLILKFFPKRKKDKFHDTIAVGVIPNLDDSRDYESKKISIGTEPNELILPILSNNEDQGLYNSCVANAITTAIEEMAIESGYPNYLELSRMDLWNKAKLLTWKHDWKKNAGVYIRDGWKAAQKNHVTIEKLFPYQKKYSLIQSNPSWLWKWYPDFEYFFITRNKERQIETALNLGARVAFGIRLTNSFIKKKDNKLYTPGKDEKEITPHCMLIIGYNKKDNSYLIRNSWNSKQWGKHNCVWVNKDWILEKAFDISYCLKKRFKNGTTKSNQL